MNQILYLCSGSFSRKNLLQVSKIPFQTVSHQADETSCSLEQPLQELVTDITMLKMRHIVEPVGQEGQKALFLTADTMTQADDGEYLAKPVDKADAIRMLIKCREGVMVGTAFCLEQRLFKNGSWHFIDNVVGYEQSWCLVDVPDEFLEFYLRQVSYLDVSGALAIEGFGEQFVKQVSGSYSAILGLPMYQLRQALMSFYFYETLGL